jgi:hypothetical protein
MNNTFNTSVTTPQLREVGLTTAVALLGFPRLMDGTCAKILPFVLDIGMCETRNYMVLYVCKWNVASITTVTCCWWLTYTQLNARNTQTIRLFWDWNGTMCLDFPRLFKTSVSEWSIFYIGKTFIWKTETIRELYVSGDKVLEIGNGLKWLRIVYNGCFQYWRVGTVS